MLNADKVRMWLNVFADKIEKNKAYLSELDQAIGDGDHGANMARGVGAMRTSLETKNDATAQDLFKTAAMALLSKIGGASGPLYGSAFISMAKKSDDSEAAPADVLEAGLEGIKKRGKAETGDKTMVDVWAPVVEAVRLGELTEALIREKVQATEALKAKKGRASYLGDRSIGHIDPGAASSGLLFEAMLESGVLNE